MKQVHVWRGHVAIAHLDLVLARDQDEPLSRTLAHLGRLGISTAPENVEVHDGVATA